MTKIELAHGALGAQLRAASYDEKDNSIAVVWTTGAAVRRRGPSGYYDETLDMSPGAVNLSRLNSGAPFLNAHADRSLSDVIGSVVPGSARIVNGQGVARITLSKAPGDADHISKIRDGVVRNISIGYEIHKIEIVERDGDVPIYRATSWTPLEISAVPIPADAGAGIVQARNKAIKTTQATVRTLPRYSVDSVRIRCMAKMQQRGLLKQEGITNH